MVINLIEFYTCKQRRATGKNVHPDCVAGHHQYWALLGPGAERNYLLSNDEDSSSVITWTQGGRLFGGI